MKERAIFLDRDGTIIVEKEFLSDPNGVELIPGVATALFMAKEAGFRLIVISNQSGVARGLMTEADVNAVNEKMIRLLRIEGIELDAIYYCPHHPRYTTECQCRKPQRGMIDQALEKYDIDLTKSYVIGDRSSDMELADNIGAKSVLVLTGYGRLNQDKYEYWQKAENLTKAVNHILSR